MFATVEDLRARWTMMPSTVSEDSVQAQLDDAGVRLVTLFPQIPEQPEGRLADVLRMVTCAMVRRALLPAEIEGVDSLTDTQGPFSTTMKYRNPTGDVFITRQERDMIEAALGTANTGFVNVSAEGW